MNAPATQALVTYELRGPVAVIGLNRPDKRNAISDRFIEAIAEVVERAEGEARAAVIHGHGRHFCSGLDLAEHSTKTAMESVRGSRRWHAVFAMIERGTIPYVSALHGAVVGGGLELASATHIRVADPTAFFALPEGQRGIFVGGGGSVRAARLMGAARMGDLMLTGRVVTAEEAERWGIVQYLTAEGGALERAVELAASAAENAEMSNYAILNALPRIQDMSSEDGLFVESIMSSLTTTTPEAEERLRAFLEKRAKRLNIPGGGDS
ncbi:enoyl-CoA hydratase [Rhodobacteraceae bacterium WD3A24]|nr:enoyl-CoA hydratase [Rhodobacteraceae bacterium WD3A24]